MYIHKKSKIEIRDKYAIVITNKDEPIFIDIDDIERVKEYNWNIDSSGYARTENGYRGNAKVILMHRLINNTPSDLSTDHINGFKTDNRKCNLRSCTKQQNMANSGARSDSTSGVRGVNYAKREKLWRARIRINKKEIGLGYFKLKEDAIKSRLEAEKIYYGEFAFENGGKDLRCRMRGKSLNKILLKAYLRVGLNID